jgi:hypothetical protein
MPEGSTITYKDHDFFNGAGLCIGNNMMGAHYFFVGVQSPPTLEQMRPDYGDRLRCAGVYSHLYMFFPDVEDGQPMEEFFASIGVAEYTVHEGIDEGWISFRYQSWDVVIGAYVKGETGAVPQKTMSSSYDTYFLNPTILEANEAIFMEANRALFA